MMWPGRKDTKEAPALPPVILMGPRVYVRPPGIYDAQAWAEVRGANRATLETLEPTWPDDALTDDFFMRRLRRQVKDWTAGTAYSFLIFLPDGALIGGININYVARGAAQSGSLGYWLDAKYQGKGYMREALAQVIHYAFDELRLHRLNAACLPGNDKSIRLLKALNFEEEGFAKSYYRINGKWEDHVTFGLITPESDSTSETPESA